MDDAVELVCGEGGVDGGLICEIGLD